MSRPIRRDGERGKSYSASVRVFCLSGRLRRCLGGESRLRGLLGLGEPSRARAVGDDDLLVIEERHPGDRRNIVQPEALAELERAEIDLDVLRNGGGQGFDAQLAGNLRHHTSDLGPGRLPDELNGDRRLNWLIEPDLVEVDVRDRAADGVLLVLLENRVVGRLCTLDHHVDDRVEPGGAGQREPKLPLSDEKGLVCLAVEDAGDQSLTPQALHVARAELVGAALLNLECDSVPGHGGEV